VYGAEAAISTRTAPKKKTRNLHLLAVIASWKKVKSHTLPTTVAVNWLGKNYRNGKTRNLPLPRRRNQ
jgi:hypothetical protein